MPARRRHPVAPVAEQHGLPTVVGTDGVTIAGFDDFVISDTEKPGPFEVACKGLPVAWRPWEKPLAPDDYKLAMQLGARRVRVKVARLDVPLFGVLALCRMPDGVKGPGSRVHRIQVPDSYVDATDGGRVSVVYEEVDDGTGGAVTSWQLFLSRSPFVGGEDESTSKADEAGRKAIQAFEVTRTGHASPAKQVGDAGPASPDSAVSDARTATPAPAPQPAEMR